MNIFYIPIKILTGDKSPIKMFFNTMSDKFPSNDEVNNTYIRRQCTYQTYV